MSNASRQRVAQRQHERIGADVEHVARLGSNLIGEGQSGSAEEMHMYVARAAEQTVLEVVVLEVGDGVGHVGFAGQKGLLPQQALVPIDSAHAAYVGRQLTREQLGAERHRSELGVCQPQIVVALRDVIGEFIGEAEAEPHRRPVGVDQVQVLQARRLDQIGETGIGLRVPGAPCVPGRRLPDVAVRGRVRVDDDVAALQVPRGGGFRQETTEIGRLACRDADPGYELGAVPRGQLIVGALDVRGLEVAQLLVGRGEVVRGPGDALGGAATIDNATASGREAALAIAATLAGTSSSQRAI